jgi:hypothetical protein
VSDDPAKTGFDRKLISLGQPNEMRDWCKALGCTEEQLRAAVKAVDNSAAKVREYLTRRHWRRHSMHMMAMSRARSSRSLER